MSERNKITDLGENINNPLHLHPRILGRDAPRPTLLKRRGGKSQGKGQAVHKSDPTGDTTGGQAWESHRHPTKQQPSGGLTSGRAVSDAGSAGVRRRSVQVPAAKLLDAPIRRASRVASVRL